MTYQILAMIMNDNDVAATAKNVSLEVTLI